MELVAGFISEALANVENDARLSLIKNDVNALMKKFPLYSNRLT